MCARVCACICTWACARAPGSFREPWCARTWVLLPICSSAFLMFGPKERKEPKERKSPTCVQVLLLLQLLLLNISADAASSSISSSSAASSAEIFIWLFISNSFQRIQLISFRIHFSEFSWFHFEFEFNWSFFRFRIHFNWLYLNFFIALHFEFEFKRIQLIQFIRIQLNFSWFQFNSSSSYNFKKEISIKETRNWNELNQLNSQWIRIRNENQ